MSLVKKASLFRVLKMHQKLAITLHRWSNRLLSSVGLLIICAVFLTTISLHSPTLIFCLLCASALAFLIQHIGEHLNLPKQYIILLQMTVLVIALSGFWIDYFADPAQAQFFKKAEDFFQNSLSQGTGSGTNSQPAVSLIFNVLRALYLLYIAISLIGVINAVRKDEDWQSVVRTPLLVIVAVTVADVLTGFVIGDTGAK